MNSMDDILKRHLEDLAVFALVRQKAWDALQKRHSEIRNAFSNREHEIPQGTKKLMEKETAQYMKEWGKDGIHEVAMKNRHLLERNKVNHIDLEKYFKEKKLMLEAAKNLSRER